MMSLFAQMGFSSVFFARIDIQDYAIRSATKRLEWVWQSSKSLGNAHIPCTMVRDDQDIVFQLLFPNYESFKKGTYCPPRQIWWDPYYGNSDPVNDDERLENVNVKALSDQLVGQMNARRAGYRSNDHLLLPFGCDFMFPAANLMFKVIEMAFLKSVVAIQ
jgi:hypothetical protein